jgi:hypothetical protein
MQVIIATRERLTPIPAKHEQTIGGHPKAKQLAAAPKPLVDIPPAAVMHAAHAPGPA